MFKLFSTEMRKDPYSLDALLIRHLQILRGRDGDVPEFARRSYLLADPHDHLKGLVLEPQGICDGTGTYGLDADFEDAARAPVDGMDAEYDCEEGCSEGCRVRLCNSCAKDICPRVLRKTPTKRRSVRLTDSEAEESGADNSSDKLSDPGNSNESSRIPVDAVANGNYLGPVPACYRDSTYAERVLLSGAQTSRETAYKRGHCEQLQCSDNENLSRFQGGAARGRHRASRSSCADGTNHRVRFQGAAAAILSCNVGGESAGSCSTRLQGGRWIRSG